MDWNILTKLIVNFLIGLPAAGGIFLLLNRIRFKLKPIQIFYVLSFTLFALGFLVGIDFFPEIIVPLVVAFVAAMVVIRVVLELPRFRQLSNDAAYLVNLFLNTAIFFLAVFLVILGLSGNWHFGSYWAFLLLAVLFLAQAINGYRSMGDRRSWRVFVGILFVIYAVAALVVQFSVTS